MKQLIIFLLAITFSNSYGQAEIETELKGYHWRKLFNKSKSTLKVKEIGLDDIPNYLDVRGIIVEALTWEDNLGQNILVLTNSGAYKFKDYYQDSKEYNIEAKQDLRAYLFVKASNKEVFSMHWKLYDFAENFGVDMSVGFVKNAVTVTDLDNNQIAEVSIPYRLIVRGGLDPGTFKIIMYEGHVKYAMRGRTAICDTDVEGNPFKDGGEFTFDKNLSNKKIFLNFLIKHWEENKCE